MNTAATRVPEGSDPAEWAVIDADSHPILDEMKAKYAGLVPIADECAVEYVVTKKLEVAGLEPGSIDANTQYYVEGGKLSFVVFFDLERFEGMDGHQRTHVFIHEQCHVLTMWHAYNKIGSYTAIPPITQAEEVAVSFLGVMYEDVGIAAGLIEGGDHHHHMSHVEHGHAQA